MNSFRFSTASNLNTPMILNVNVAVNGIVRILSELLVVVLIRQKLYLVGEEA
jgi:hypothetical protein